eukprot:6186616-Pleurochrysis_carterae.AAC.2
MSTGPRRRAASKSYASRHSNKLLLASWVAHQRLALPAWGCITSSLGCDILQICFAFITRVFRNPCMQSIVKRVGVVLIDA